MIYGELLSSPAEDVSILVRVDNHKWSYLCDCGEAERLTAAECVRLGAIFISHTHIDHFIYFDTILRFQLGIERTVTICGPPEIARHLQSKVLGYNWNLVAKGAVRYEIREIGQNGVIRVFELEPPEWELKEIGELKGDLVYENESLRVSYVLLDHGIPSVAYLFSEPDRVKAKELPFTPGPWVGRLKEAYIRGDEECKLEVDGKTIVSGELFGLLERVPGYRVGVVMDHLACTENHERIINCFHGADRLYIESYYLDVDRELALKNFHSTAKESGRAARKAGVKEVVPIHFSRRYGVESHSLIEECLREFRGL